MRRMSLVLVTTFALTSVPAFAKKSMHCHKAEGESMVDLPDAKDEAACGTAGGVWAAHEPHCHLTVEGKSVDAKEHKTKKACLANKGEWTTDHPATK